MSVTLYPVAATAEAALHAPQGFAARESEARAVAAHDVRFAAEPVGPLFASRDAAQAAYAAGGRGGAALADGWGRLTPVASAAGAPGGSAPLKPSYADGRRWPAAPVTEAPTQWRLWVSYWRIADAASETFETPVPDVAARRLRRREEGQGLAPAMLNALARQPLRPVRPQQPLDIGLFETRTPEDPDLIIPDE
jgi:hypothetical protein